MKRLIRLVPAMLALTALVPIDALACAVCGGGNPANRLTFFLSTIALSILPLGLFTGGVFWLRKKLREHRPDEFQDRDNLVSLPEPSPATDGGAPRS